MKKILFTLLSIFCTHLLPAQIPVKIWDYRYGGNDRDLITSFQQTADGGYLLGGYSKSPASGDKANNSKGGFDYWIIKLDSSGGKEWVGN